MKVGVSARADVPERAKVAREVADQLRGEADLVATPRLAQELGTPAAEIEHMDVDVLVTIGGDGTILYALHRTDAPLCGVNMGQVGFLTSTEPDQVRGAMARLVDGDYEVEERSRIASTLGDERLPDATNEVVLKSPRPSKVLEICVERDGQEVMDLRSDGVIVATATGSTGYSLSAGGPLVDPAVDCFLVVPLADFDLGSRSFVVPLEATFTATLAADGKPGVLSVDGQVERDVRPGQELSFTRSDDPARFVRFDRDFYDRVRERLL